MYLKKIGEGLFSGVATFVPISSDVVVGERGVSVFYIEAKKKKKGLKLAEDGREHEKENSMPLIFTVQKDTNQA